jgi:hypothetical protein
MDSLGHVQAWLWKDQAMSSPGHGQPKTGHGQPNQWADQAVASTGHG